MRQMSCYAITSWIVLSLIYEPPVESRASRIRRKLRRGKNICLRPSEPTFLLLGQQDR